MLARICSSALAFFTITAAASANVFEPKVTADSPINKLVSGAKVIRALNDAEEQEADIHLYKVVFEKVSIFQSLQRRSCSRK